MKESGKFISPALFLLVALCFFLPFVSFTCQGQKIATVTGMELITGTKIDKLQVPQLNQQKEDSELLKQSTLDSEPLAIAAFIFAIIGIAGSFITRYSRILAIIAAVLGVLMLLFLRSSLGKEITGDLEFRIIEISYEWGYYLAIIIFVTVFGLNIYEKITEFNSVKSEPIDFAAADLLRCPDCGYTNSSGSLFCSKCGHTLV